MYVLLGLFYDCVTYISLLAYNKDILKTIHTGTDTSAFKAKDNIDLRTSSEMLPSVSNDTGVVSILHFFLRLVFNYNFFDWYSVVCQLHLMEIKWQQVTGKET